MITTTKVKKHLLFYLFFPVTGNFAGMMAKIDRGKIWRFHLIGTEREKRPANIICLASLFCVCRKGEVKSYLKQEPFKWWKTKDFLLAIILKKDSCNKSNKLLPLWTIHWLFKRRWENKGEIICGSVKIVFVGSQCHFGQC